jgi:hypothetical protein
MGTDHSLQGCGGLESLSRRGTGVAPAPVASVWGWVSPSSKKRGAFGGRPGTYPVKALCALLARLEGSRLGCPAGRGSNWTGRIGVWTWWFRDWPLVVARELPLWVVSRALNVVGVTRGFFSPLPGVGL